VKLPHFTLIAVLLLGAVVLVAAAPSSAYAAFQHDVRVLPSGALWLHPQDSTDTTSLVVTVYTSAKGTANAGTAQYTSYFDETQATITVDRNITTRGFCIPLGEPDGLKAGWNLVVLKQGSTVVEKIPYWLATAYLPPVALSSSSATLPVSLAGTLPVTLSRDTSLSVSADSTLPVTISDVGGVSGEVVAGIGGIMFLATGLAVGTMLVRKR